LKACFYVVRKELHAFSMQFVSVVTLHYAYAMSINELAFGVMLCVSVYVPLCMGM